MGKIYSKQGHPPKWLQLEKNEKLLFCGISHEIVRNPLSKNEKTPECIILTDKRLVALGVYSDLGRPAVTSIPLSQIQSITSVCGSWTPFKIILCVLLFLAFILPGLFYWIIVESGKGPGIVVGAGWKKLGIDFHPDTPELFDQFLTYLEFYSSFK